MRFFPSHVRTPTVLQMEATECGAASLGIILAYYGRHVPLETLRMACGVSRDGSNAANLLKAARNFGCQAKAFRKGIPRLRAMPLPVIVFWEFRHYLVVDAFNKNGVRINDPATGPRIVSHETFDQSYSGLVLDIRPGPEFKPGGKRPGFFRILTSRLATVKPALAALVLIGLAMTLPRLAVPVILQQFIDQVLVAGQTSATALLSLGLAVALCLTAGLTWAQQSTLLRMETRLALDMSGQFLWHLLKLPVSFFQQRFPGDISSRVAINNTVAQLLSREIATNILNGLMILLIGAMMVYLAPSLAGLTMLLALANLGILALLSRTRTDTNARLLQERGKWIGSTMAGLQMIETFKSTGRESDFFTQWAGQQARALNVQQDFGRPTQILAVLPTLMTGLNHVVVLLVGGSLVMSGRMTLGSLVAFQTLLLSFSTPINRMVSLGSQLQEAKGELLRLADVMDYPEGSTDTWLDEAPAPAQAGKLSGELRMQNVSFGYGRLNPPLIKDFSLLVRPGQRIALVGGSGCGKSTIVKLICGLVSPWEGNIEFDGTPGSGISRARLFLSLAMVNQEIFLFEGTVRDNLTLWDTTIPETQILRAAKDACIHDEITLKQNGYGTQVEEGGRNFSGGQSQRLEIARALVNEPSILVLDEATNALDPSVEQAIDRHLRRRGCTCIFVAHRLSTIRDCDEIIVMDKGAIVQRGTHDQLVAQGGLYLDLIEA